MTGKQREFPIDVADNGAAKTRKKIHPVLVKRYPRIERTIRLRFMAIREAKVFQAPHRAVFFLSFMIYCLNDFLVVISLINFVEIRTIHVYIYIR